MTIPENRRKTSGRNKLYITSLLQVFENIEECDRFVVHPIKILNRIFDVCKGRSYNDKRYNWNIFDIQSHLKWLHSCGRVPKPHVKIYGPFLLSSNCLMGYNERWSYKTLFLIYLLKISKFSECKTEAYWFETSWSDMSINVLHNYWKRNCNCIS